MTNVFANLAGMVGSSLTKFAATAPAAAAASAAGAAAPVVVAAVAAAPKGGSVIGLLGGTAGLVGLVATGISTYKDTVGGGGKQLLDSALFSGSTGAIAAGVVMLGLGEGAKVGSVLVQNGLRGAGLALMAGGVIGAVAGVAQRYFGPTTDRAAASTLLQRAQNFTTDLPATPANLEGMAVAYGEAVTTEKRLLDLGMYIDPTTAQAVAAHADGAAAEVGEAIGVAHARAQADDQDRSFAVVKTHDGALWTARLSGDLDQVDGRNYTKDNTFDPYEKPLIGKHQAALQAIAGIESVYVFPKGISTTEAAQPTGSVPWIEPTLSAATPGGN